MPDDTKRATQNECIEARKKNTHENEKKASSKIFVRSTRKCESERKAKKIGIGDTYCVFFRIVMVGLMLCKCF